MRDLEVRGLSMVGVRTVAVLFAVLAVVATGCASAAEDAVDQTETSAAPADDNEDHDGDEHDHDGGSDADDGGLTQLENGQMHHEVPDDVALDADTQRALDAQLDATRALVDLYPTVADAEAAGWRRAGPFSPGLGSHYTAPAGGYNGDGVIDEADLATPTLIYDGNEPSSPIAGFMYQSFRQDEPEGFAGPNDHWHYHTSVCIVAGDDGEIDTPLGADREVSDEQCASVGGGLIDFTGYMVHVWTVPGYESPRGIFSDLNPALTCPDGSYHTIDIEDLGTNETLCRT